MSAWLHECMSEWLHECMSAGRPHTQRARPARWSCAAWARETQDHHGSATTQKVRRRMGGERRVVSFECLCLPLPPSPFKLRRNDQRRRTL